MNPKDLHTHLQRMHEKSKIDYALQLISDAKIILSHSNIIEDEELKNEYLSRFHYMEDKLRKMIQNYEKTK